MDDWATPEVDAFSALQLEQQFKVKKFVQERDEEKFNVQCTFLIATGPLCGLHDCIENDSAPLYEEIEVAFEQVLWLLGSANAQLSILKRHRGLAVINRSRTNLAELPLPNAKSWLFGDDFPLLASKHAELSRGLTHTKNWHRLQGNPFLDVVIVPSLKADIEETPLTNINPLGIPTLLNLCQITKGLVQKPAFSSPSPEGTSARLPECMVSWRTLTSDPQILSIVSGYIISFLKTPFQKSPPFIQTSGQEALLISQDVNELLQKGAIHKSPFTRDSFF